MLKIDLIYLWVDGSDPAWLAKKNAALQSLGRSMAASSVAAQRWRDHDELKYSLRSVEKFVPWINHIHIVTDGQVPKWLDANHPRVSIVDHAAIIPPDYLPNFNSNAIEFFIHRIPGLAEHFLYANDDMFFGQPLTPDFFFDPAGNPIVIAKERGNRRAFRNKRASGNWEQTKWNALNLVREKFGLQYNITFKHAIEPQRKSHVREFAAKFHDEIIAPSATPFRERTNVQRMIFPMLDNARGRNHIVLNWRTGEQRITYDIHKDSFLRRAGREMRWLLATLFGFVRYDCYDKQWRIAHFVRKYRPAMFTINDQGSGLADGARLLSEMFPEKSGFEK